MEQQEDGANPNSWGTVLNNNVIALIDDAIAAYTTIALTNETVTLTNENGASDQARSAFLELTGTLTSSVNVVLPAKSKGYFVRNKTTPDASETVTRTDARGSDYFINQTVYNSASKLRFDTGTSSSNWNNTDYKYTSPVNNLDVKYLGFSVSLIIKGTSS